MVGRRRQLRRRIQALLIKYSDVLRTVKVLHMNDSLFHRDPWRFKIRTARACRAAECFSGTRCSWKSAALRVRTSPPCRSSTGSSRRGVPACSYARSDLSSPMTKRNRSLMPTRRSIPQRWKPPRLPASGSWRKWIPPPPNATTLAELESWGRWARDPGDRSAPGVVDLPRRA